MPKPNDFPNEITLETIKGGAAPLIWQHDFQKVLDNMADNNTNPLAKRTLTLKFTFEQSADRTQFATHIESTLKLAATNSVSTICYTAKARNGRNAAVEGNPNQLPFQFAESPAPVARPTDS